MKSLNPLWKLGLFVHTKFAYQDLPISAIEPGKASQVGGSAPQLVRGGRWRIPNLIPSYSGAANDVAAVILVSFLFIGPDTAIFACFLCGEYLCVFPFRSWGERGMRWGGGKWHKSSRLEWNHPLVGTSIRSSVSLAGAAGCELLFARWRWISRAVAAEPFRWRGRLINGLFIIIFYGSFLAHFFFLPCTVFRFLDADWKSWPQIADWCSLNSDCGYKRVLINWSLRFVLRPKGALSSTDRVLTEDENLLPGRRPFSFLHWISCQYSSQWLITVWKNATVGYRLHN